MLPEHAINGTGTDTHEKHLGTAELCHSCPFKQIVRSPLPKPERVCQQSRPWDDKQVAALEHLERLKPAICLARYANENASQESAQPAAALPGFNKSAADWHGLAVLSCCQGLGSRADARNLRFRQKATNMVNGCLKSNLV